MSNQASNDSDYAILVVAQLFIQHLEKEIKRSSKPTKRQASIFWKDIAEENKNLLMKHEEENKNLLMKHEEENKSLLMKHETETLQQSEGLPFQQ